MSAHCFLNSNPPYTKHAYYLDTVRLLFLEKNPPCAIIRSYALIKFGIFGLFSQIFRTFLPNSSKIFSSIFPLFMPIWSIFPIFVLLVNYTVRLFHPVHLLKFGVFPPCAFIPSCVFIKIGRSSTLCVYFSLCGY